MSPATTGTPGAADMTGQPCRRERCTGSGIITVRGRCHVCGHPAQAAETGPDHRRVEPDSKTTAPMTLPPSRPSDQPGNSSRPTLSGGLFALPALPDLPLTGPPILAATTSVARALRRCGWCEAEVARSGDGPVDLEGRCGSCGQPYSFTVKLGPDDVIGSRYRIVGPLAHGGQGWVYAARDEHLSDHQLSDHQVVSWVAVKGLLDTAIPEARGVVENERRALTAVSHPNIVKIRDFVTHDGADYIVMDYVHGWSLKKCMQTSGGALAPADAARYLLRLLPALDYLHRYQLVYCDLKPDNVMVTSDELTLIDLGGARRVDDTTSNYLSTPSFRAPEIDDAAYRDGAERAFPSIASDLYAASRMLAMLVLGGGWEPTRKNRHTLPSSPVFDAFDSLYRLLLKGTARRPEDRFGSAHEMAEELVGVLHEIVAAPVAGPGGVPVESRWRAPVVSRWFEPAPPIFSEQADSRWQALAALRVDPDDPAALALDALSVREESAALADRLAALEPMTVEVRLRRVRAEIDAGRLDRAHDQLDALAVDEPRDWRVGWYRGLAAMVDGEATAAAGYFDRVYAQVPGELMPRFAHALALEQAGDLPAAARILDIVSRTDPSISSAAFAHARCVSDPKDRVEAYSRVTANSRTFVTARTRMIELLVADEPGQPPTATAITKACGVFEEAKPEIGEDQRHALRLAVLAAAELLVGSGADTRGDTPTSSETLPATVFGIPLDITKLGLERERLLRERARLATTRADRVRLVTLANRVRPRTWT
ncbi:tetratricopeptide repeat protein [Frankia sp. Cr1]|uniref:tetratricopeptide repeat protein n=1 Tax=Frankia sp. Cr1 TaxID=3073931 RepID=UPI002AD4C7BC|nr:tetratricopeptide repeat protein [Frankia sp. Cr1]